MQADDGNGNHDYAGFRKMIRWSAMILHVPAAYTAFSVFMVVAPEGVLVGTFIGIPAGIVVFAAWSIVIQALTRALYIIADLGEANLPIKQTSQLPTAAHPSEDARPQ